MSDPIIRDHEITREFATTREHRMAHIERLYDFEPDPEPVTVKATDPTTGEVLAHFHLDSDREVYDLNPIPASTTVLSGPGQVEEPVEVALPEPELVILSADDDVTPTPVAAAITAPGTIAAAKITPGTISIDKIAATNLGNIETGSDFPEGMNLGHLLVLARDLADSNLPVGGKVKAITREDGTVTRLAITSP